MGIMGVMGKNKTMPHCCPESCVLRRIPLIRPIGLICPICPPVHGTNNTKRRGGAALQRACGSNALRAISSPLRVFARQHLLLFLADIGDGAIVAPRISCFAGISAVMDEKE